MNNDYSYHLFTFLVRTHLLRNVKTDAEKWLERCSNKLLKHILTDKEAVDYLVFLVFGDNFVDLEKKQLAKQFHLHYPNEYAPILKAAKKCDIPTRELLKKYFSHTGNDQEKKKKILLPNEINAREEIFAAILSAFSDQTIEGLKLEAITEDQSTLLKTG